MDCRPQRVSVSRERLNNGTWVTAQLFSSSPYASPSIPLIGIPLGSESKGDESRTQGYCIHCLCDSATRLYGQHHYYDQELTREAV